MNADRWEPRAVCPFCGRRVAEGSAWQGDDGVRWGAHWDCHLRAKQEQRARSADSNASLRSIRGRVAAYTRWANTDDRSKATWPARKAFEDRFEREVDPEGKLGPQERAKRAEFARKAYYQRLAMKSVQARQRRQRS